MSKLLTGTCLINLINIMVFLFQEKLSGFLLRWNGKYGAVQCDGRQYSTGLFSERIPVSCGQGSLETGFQNPDGEEGVGCPCK